MNSHKNLGKINIVDRLYSMMRSCEDTSENRNVFDNKSTREIGKYLNDKYSADGLFDTVRILSEMIMYQETTNAGLYYIDLRQLEFVWSGIAPEFNA